MSGVSGLVATGLHAALVGTAAPLVAGAVRWTRARALGQAAAPAWQEWRELRRLARKQPVVADAASWVFTAAPYGQLAAVAAAAMLVPSFTLGMATAPASDLVVLAGLFALARLALAVGAMEAGTAWAGLGAGRTVLAAGAAPALLLVVLAVALMTGTTELDAAAAVLRDGASGGAGIPFALAAAAIVALAECGSPHGSPQGREAAAAEYSGRHLALVQYAASLLLLTWLDLIAALFLPEGLAADGAGVLAWAGGAVAWAAKVAVLGAALAAWQAGAGRMRRLALPRRMGVAALLGLLAVLLVLLGQGFA